MLNRKLREKIPTKKVVIQFKLERFHRVSILQIKSQSQEGMKQLKRLEERTSFIQIHSRSRNVVPHLTPPLFLSSSFLPSCWMPSLPTPLIQRSLFPVTCFLPNIHGEWQELGCLGLLQGHSVKHLPQEISSILTNCFLLFLASLLYSINGWVPYCYTRPYLPYVFLLCAF